MFGGMSLREPAKFDELGLGRFQGQAELSQPFAQGVLNPREDCRGSSEMALSGPAEPSRPARCSTANLRAPGRRL